MTLAVTLSSCRERPAAPARVIDDRAAIEAYGYGPDPKGSARYQPDVILIEGGPRAVRSVSDDGQTWIIDAKAGGARDLAIGKIMFATSRAVGRVNKLQKRGDELVVTLEPARFTEIVRDARINFDAAIKPDAMVFRTLPSEDTEPANLRHQDTSGGVITVASQKIDQKTGDIVLSMAPLLLIATAAPPASDFALVGSDPKFKYSAQVTVRDFDITAYHKEERGKEVLSLAVARKLASHKSTQGPASVGLKFGGEVKLVTKNMVVRTRLNVEDGALAATQGEGGATFVLDGVEEFEVGIFGGASNGILDNTNLRVEVPIEILFEIPPGPETAGIPMVLQFKSKFYVATAFGSKNATLKATGRYGLNGPIGIQGGTVVAPAITVNQPMLQNLEGPSVSANGIVFAVEHRVLGGIGTKMAMGGLYAKLTISVGLTVGSSIGIIQCKGATLKVDVAAGMGIQGSKELGGVLEKILGKTIAPSFEIGEVTVNALNRSVSVPDVPLCKG